MKIIITEWALQSYLDLIGSHIFTREEYKTIIRPDVESLKKYPDGEKFNNNKFWGRATLKNSECIENGWKMKWHNLGPGAVQLRLCVAIVKGTVFLCQAYVKKSKVTDNVQAATFTNRIDLIEQGCYETRGML